MESRVKVMGHGLHPVLIAFPLGLLATSLVFDIIHLIDPLPEFSIVAFWLIPAGIVGGLLAAVPGLIDWLAVPLHTRARRIGLTHAIVNVVALAIFFLSWEMRRPNPGYVPTTTGVIVSAIGACFAMLGGWFGGELVERLGLSVYDDANVNAPSSV